MAVLPARYWAPPRDDANNTGDKDVGAAKEVDSESEGRFLADGKTGGGEKEGEEEKEKEKVEEKVETMISEVTGREATIRRAHLVLERHRAELIRVKEEKRRQKVRGRVE